MSIPIDTITDRKTETEKLRSENTELLVLLYITLALFGVVLIVAMLQRTTINELKAENKQLESYKKYKCDWEDFNRSFIPSTALPRLPKTEAIIKERE